MSDERELEVREGTRLMLSGAGLGLVGAASAVALGATCPLCVVGAPALIGWGAYKRWSATRAGSAELAASSEPGGPT